MPGEVIERAVAEFEGTNGTKVKDLNTKQLVLILHSELKEKIDNHIKDDEKLSKALNDHDILFQKIMNVLPEKGFCERTDNALYPKGDHSMAYKMEQLWHDRRWFKYIFSAIMGVGAIGTINIILHFWG